MTKPLAQRLGELIGEYGSECSMPPYELAPSRALASAMLEVAALEGRIAKLEAENAEFRKDAKRYRWLRGKIKDYGSKPDLTIAEVGGWELRSWCGDAPDKTIDAAIAKQGKP